MARWPTLPRAGAGTLYRFENGQATPIVQDVTISNGLAWSADGLTLYYVDTPLRRVDAFDYDLQRGSVSHRRTVIRIEEGAGDPDGICVDREGGIWVALWGGAAVQRYDADGRLTETIEVPTPFVTSTAFVGADLDVLLVTTASDENPGEPGAGDVYVASVGIAGAAPHRADPSRVFDPSTL